MTRQLTSAIARIHQANGRVVGAGFLVSHRHVMTCAHVINAAVGQKPSSPSEPHQAIPLDFPLVASGNILKGRVLRWFPVQPSASISPETSADMALLELENLLPEGTQPLRLVKAENLWKHPFRVFGFPEGQPVGVWTDGIISNPQGNGRVQIEVLRATAYSIEPGFSGSPVWDEQLDGVAGMTVAIDSKRPGVRAAFIIPTTQLINACPELAEQAIPPCPYKGLSAFQEQDTQFFFGRETFNQQLVQAVHKQPLVAVIGPSGSGKSSVVFAGLIPQLRAKADWLIESFRPGDSPFRNLAVRLVSLLEKEMSQTDQLVEVNKLVKRIEEGILSLEDLAGRILENNSGYHLLLIADQFEELYTLCQDNGERQLFLEQLLAAVNQIENFKLVLTLRADFCGYALDYRPFADALQDTDRKLGPMNREELQEVIERPARLLGVKIEPGLTERILAAVEQEPGNLPLLEFALTLLWGKQQNGQLTHQAYEEIGGVERALAEYAEEQYESLKEKDKKRAEKVFIQLVQLGEGTEDTRRIASRDEVGEENWDLVTKLASVRLVVTNRREESNQETVEVIHEALIHHWSRLRSLLENNREVIRTERKIQMAAEEWQEKERAKDYLLTGLRLGEAEKFLQDSDHIVPLSGLGREFIEESRQEQDRLVKEQEERQKQELERERKARRGWQWLAAMLGVIATGSVSVFGYRQVLRLVAIWRTEMADIEGGNALIGTKAPDAQEEEQPQWTTYISPFQIQKFEVSNRQYNICVEVGPCDEPKDPAQLINEELLDYPVVEVTALHAATYCNWLGMRLPTELEWERAARGLKKDDKKWPWGNEEPVENFANIYS